MAVAHVFCALQAFVKMEERRSRGLIARWYELKRHLIDRGVGAFTPQFHKNLVSDQEKKRERACLLG
jgi:hypothetical protein